MLKEEKQFKKTLETHKKDNEELTRTIALKQKAIYGYLNELEQPKKELAIVKCEAENVDKKLNSYLHARHVLDYIVEKPSKEEVSASTAYKSCPPPALFENHNFDVVVDKESSSNESDKTTTGVADPYSDVRPVLGVNNEGVVAVTDESDDESVEKSEPRSEVEIPLENHILCDPEPKVQKSPPKASACAKSSTHSTYILREFIFTTK